MEWARSNCGMTGQAPLSPVPRSPLPARPPSPPCAVSVPLTKRAPPPQSSRRSVFENITRVGCATPRHIYPLRTSYLTGSLVMVEEGEPLQVETATHPRGALGVRGAGRARAKALRRSSRALAALWLVALLLLAPRFAVLATPRTPDGNHAARTSIDLAALSDSFIENAGQLRNDEIRFYAASGALRVGFAESAVLIRMIDRAPSNLDVTTTAWAM